MLKAAVNTYKLVNNIKKVDASNSLESKKASKAIYDLLLQEKGIFLKIGQALGSSHRFEQVVDIQKLTEQSSEVIPLDQVRDIIYSVIPKNELLELHESTRPGSLGQVHMAKLQSGEKLAIKVLYPNIREKLKQQLSLFQMLPTLSKATKFSKWNFPIEDYSKMISQVINFEQSYTHEGQNHLTWQKKNSMDKVNTSILYPEFSSNDVLTQSWISGDHLHFVEKSYSNNQKRECSQVILKSFLFSVLKSGFIQIDNHDGNFIFNRKDNISVSFIDFGNCIQINDKLRKALIYIIHNTIEERDINLLGVYKLLGFDNEKLKHSKQCLNLITKYLFEPFIYSHAYNIKSWDLNEKLNKTLGEQKWWFRSAGDTVVFQIMRSLMGIISILNKLDEPVVWKKIFYEVVDLEEIKNFESEIPIDKDEVPCFTSMAKNLNISIIKEGIEKVNINMPSSVIIELDSVISDEIKTKLAKRNIIITDIIKTSLGNGLIPQEVFKLEEENSIYTVSLK